MNVSDIITEILGREGSKYTNDPADKGGPTKFGITQKTLSDYRGQPVTPEEVARLTEPEARSIYFQLFVRGPGFQKIIDEQLMALAVDCAVNHGRSRCVKWLQAIAGVTQDGVLGPMTADAINRMDARTVYRRLLAQRVRSYGRLVTDDPTQARFAAGWANRAAEFIEAP